MPSVESHLAVRRSEQGLEVELTGEWRALELEQLDAELGAVDLASTRRVLVRTKALTALDLTGAWRLREFLQNAREAGAEVQFQGAPPDQLRLVDSTLKGEGPPLCKDEKEF
jgi:hypothetical protein